MLLGNTTRDYVFLSYSHANKDAVSAIIQWFKENRYNVVFDSEIIAGEMWDKAVRGYIGDAKCKGVLVIMSEASLNSFPVLKEMDYAELFHKRSAAILLDDCSVDKLSKARIEAEDNMVKKEILKYFPDEKMHINAKEIVGKENGADETLMYTLENWGLHQGSAWDSGSIDISGYTSFIEGEKQRLSSQREVYYSFDMEAINRVLDKYPDDAQLTVLDLGCSNGMLTMSRFTDAKIAHVVGIDYNQSDIGDAISGCTDARYNFFCMDMEEEGFKERLVKELSSLSIAKVDIVFMALTLHHLKKPQKLLRSLKDVLNSNGCLIIRGSDDGAKLCHPENELMHEFFDRYAKIVNKVTDRNNGRKLYSQLYNSGYSDITMLYQNADTCSRSESDKAVFYHVGFDFREQRLNEIAKKNPSNESIQDEVRWQLATLEKIKGMFMQEDFWYLNTSFIAIASIG